MKIVWILILGGLAGTGFLLVRRAFRELGVSLASGVLLGMLAFLHSVKLHWLDSLPEPGLPALRLMAIQGLGFAGLALMAYAGMSREKFFIVTGQRWPGLGKGREFWMGLLCAGAGGCLFTLLIHLAGWAYGIKAMSSQAEFLWLLGLFVSSFALGMWRGEWGHLTGPRKLLLQGGALLLLAYLLDVAFG